ncbi:MAG: sporulation protein YqfD, partial [Clostridia bacterium]|nr:sporulation protein YqfD [Clostridia bacterium]
MFYWKFPCGYVTINVECARPELFLNRLFADGVSAHNICRTQKCLVTLTVRSRELPKALDTAAELGGTASVTASGGLPVLLASLLKRPALLVSMSLALAALLLLSSHVIAIRVEGCGQWLESEAIALLASENIKPGVRASEIDTNLLEEKLTALDPDISSVTVRIDGVELVCNFRMRRQSDSAPPDLPSSIYADKDCVIVSLAAFDGKAAVSPGAAVRKGDLLVSGDVTPEGSETPVLVGSRAEIVGEVAYSFTVRVEPSALSPFRSGASARLIRISFFGLSIGSSPGFEAYESELDRLNVFSAAGLPVRILCGTAWELVLGRTEKDRGEILDEMRIAADALIRERVPKDARIISKTT